MQWAEGLTNTHAVDPNSCLCFSPPPYRHLSPADSYIPDTPHPSFLANAVIQAGNGAGKGQRRRSTAQTPHPCCWYEPHLCACICICMCMCMCMCVLPPSSRAWCKMLHSLTLCSPLQLPPPQPLKSLRLTAPDAGPAFIEHCLLEEGFPPNARVNDGCDLSKGAQIAPKHAKLARDGERRREMEGDGETERDRGPPAYAHMHTHPYTRAHMHTHAPPPIPFLRECHHVLFRYAATATGTAER